jgi:hypothetical protein
VYDAQHALEHPEVASWALGALDTSDAASFEEHLRSCEQCQDQAAEFAPAACSLPLAAPTAEPPPDLELKVLAAVRYAVMAGSRTEPAPEPERRPEPVAPKPGPASKASRWWHFHWTNPLLPAVTALGAAAVTAAVLSASTTSSRPLQQWRRLTTSVLNLTRLGQRRQPPVLPPTAMRSS